METAFENSNNYTGNEQTTNENNATRNYNGMKMSAPHANLVLTFGIISIFTFCCCSGILGIIFAILALVFAAKSKKEFNANRELYDENSFGKVRSGKTCAIIGLVLGLIIFTIAIVVVNVLSPDELMHIDGGWNQMGY
jgi:hypothetical protein